MPMIVAIIFSVISIIAFLVGSHLIKWNLAGMIILALTIIFDAVVITLICKDLGF